MSTPHVVPVWAPQVARCNSCNAAIRWATSQKSGTPTPLDADPDPTGNIVLWQTKVHEVAIAHYLKKGEDPGPQLLWRNHFASCPNAAKHRKGAVRKAVDRTVARVREGA